MTGYSKKKEKHLARVLYACLVIAAIMAAGFFIGGNKIFTDSSSNKKDPSEINQILE